MASQEIHTGVYVIRNKITYKQYVGSTAVGFKSRKANHWKCLRNGYHINRYLQAAWDKYGEEAFEFFIVWAGPPQLCIKYEQIFIDQQRSAEREFGYNLSPTAGSVLGIKFSEESKRKLSEIMSSPEMKEKISRANKGKKRTKEFCEHMSKVLTGRTLSKEHKAAIKAGNKRYKESLKNR